MEGQSSGARREGQWTRNPSHATFAGMKDPAVARARFRQWIVIAAWIGSSTTLLILDFDAPATKKTPAGCAVAVLTALAHGLWVTLDAQALNRKVGGWRFAAFLLGPLAIWLWLIREYRAKALYLIPISIAIYLIPVAQVSVAIALGLLPEPK